MNRGLVVIVILGLGATLMLGLLATHYIQSDPALKVGPLLDLRGVVKPIWGDRLGELTWALDAERKPMVGRAVRAVYRPRYGPDAPPRLEQHRELGRALLQNYAGPTRLEWAEVRGTLEPETAWERVTAQFLAPPGSGDYPPRSSNPHPGAQPGAGNGTEGGQR